MQEQGIKDSLVPALNTYSRKEDTEVGFTAVIGAGHALRNDVRATGRRVCT